ncbi:MAG: MBL fold metallo-hydrolase [Alicyclobacillus sp.]|nr:MBL fold metallo-hydrolase [Alicyclobacillus sp.]
MPCYICTTCGTQYSPSSEPPLNCRICNEERQYVNPHGQSWTTLEEMRQGGRYRNEIEREEGGIYSITTQPGFAIGQTAYLVQHPDCSILWDCLTYLDDATLSHVERLGGLRAIALSHPHYYSAQVEWAEAFDVPIYIHEDDAEWVVRPSSRIRFWAGDAVALAEGLTLHRIGGHFRGGTVLHWAGGAEGQGTLFSGDILQVVADTRWVSFMYSYPNLIPLPAAKVAEMADRVSELPFERLYGAFHRVVRERAREAVQRSAARYIAALNGELFET